ncbi:hypothetical protein EXIGLDRAFT_351248 [Exidia glandulosa HHB12029]|uniref:Uncharacterized protein n=1 Tax=Exidia glandulosa HHB12029 TaxID=1314781 RepID=A0A165CDA7_EXIGL|nr:hypothetical protein EXIGLDRAFT_351248 [Exidia glandulosa HHB12029]
MLSTRALFPLIASLSKFVHGIVRTLVSIHESPPRRPQTSSTWSFCGDLLQRAMQRYFRSMLPLELPCPDQIFACLRSKQNFVHFQSILHFSDSLSGRPLSGIWRCSARHWRLDPAPARDF